MLRAALRRLRTYTEARALVLMYHRVAEPETDVWDLAVSPANFEQQLRVLRQTGLVIPAGHLVAQLAQKNLKRRSIVVTFDDGYCDNYRVAKPLLERYQLPATFFIPTGHLGQAREFWWDELEAIFLLQEHLPRQLAVSIDGQQVAGDLQEEAHLASSLRQRHRQWRVGTGAPPSRRAALFYEIWRRLKVLPDARQQHLLRQLNIWAGRPATARPAYQMMSAAQVSDLGRTPLLSIGAHTVTHPALSSQPLAVQRNELLHNRQALSQLARPLPLLAYPYGDYAAETSALAAELGFEAAFTTSGSVVTARSDMHQLSRFQVNNWGSNEFSQRLQRWFRQ
ncbi:polysaccharide deacetylase family protein [Hymenobacter cheonanensis]|uniref:polysaccharide deacetylase family protein n=1 Tax=Hymenobacter sp. CA2-7 TaxID=3063993 RepID=UPI002714472D|nr:polysaccharide deacetylase family protein [Hymenobacter sp. CA2-7]MDO7885545.1 polysaccharide deacetylase family protein [Hymenobacter sp. CA2-7]